jgi:FkbM family methyltransferase
MWFIFKRFFFIFFHRAFAWVAPQEGEVILLKRIFGIHKDKGFFVDIGAHHPTRFSNTEYFYNLGWNGINVEPNKNDFKVFLNKRKRDINLNCAVLDGNEVDFYEYSEPALNTLSYETVIKRKLQGIDFINKNKISTISLEEMFKIFLPSKTEIDFLNIDVEGAELKILMSNNWKLFLPKVIICEVLSSNLENILESEINIFLKTKGYYIFSKLHNSVIFINSRFEKKLNL